MIDDKKDEQLYKMIVNDCDYIGAGLGFNSDIFSLLALILAYYKHRGTIPEAMISSSEMKRQIANYLVGAEQAELQEA